MKIKLSVTGFFVLSALAVTSFAGKPSTDEDLIKSMAPGAQGIEKVDRKVSSSDQQKINAALGMTLTDADFSAPIYRLKAPLDQPPFSKDAEVMVAIVTVPGPRGDIKLGVGVHTYKRGKNTARVLTHVKIFEHKEDKEIEKPEFLNQFLGVSYGAGIERSLDELKKAIEKSKGVQADDLKASLAVNWAMHQVAPLFESIRDKAANRDKAGGAAAEQFVRVLDQAEKSVGKVTFLSEGDRQFVKGEFGKFRDEMKDMAAAFKSGQFDKIKQFTLTAGGRYCGACHGPMQKKFGEHRDSLGVDDEYFMVDYDTFVPSKNHPEAYQAVATGIKKGILLILSGQ